ncbi:ABC transporter ATP-binding protein [Reinekea thalattae]|uniref:ABC transporter ATP-binding protein n=1 Tax=Reinekea thalattae TaxID=2593301 RepID=A0A5C8Z297_9GAMM|nr:ABC transporter ATP-binding protein [Reinekea thalattae]TXR51351.1 ABC transporter ATP-binding protein [Reinekea thalattae]
MSAISIDALQHRWPGQSTPILSIDNLHINEGDRFFIQGASGSGKSTLLNILAGVLTPSTGQLSILGQNFSQLSASARDQFRADNIGYIFQQFNLLPYLSVIENVLLPCHASKARAQKATDQYGSPSKAAEYALDSLNIPKPLFHTSVMRLSVGQQQRVAAARALIGNPKIIIADEPTSALDQENVGHFMETLQQKCSDIQATLLFVSHDKQLSRFFDQQLSLTAPKQDAAL